MTIKRKGNPLGLRKGQMYDRHKNSSQRLANEAKHLRRKLRELGGLSPGDAARLRRVSGRIEKVNYHEAIRSYVFNGEEG